MYRDVKRVVPLAGDAVMTEEGRAIVLESVLSCPHCGFARTERMPTDACLYFYRCTSCGTLLRPKAGDCCVFCSYGSVKCPPMQAERGCGGRSCG